MSIAVRVNRNSRILFVVFGKPFIRRLALPFGLLLLTVLQADAIVSWTALRQQLAALDPWQAALLFTILVSSWSIAAGWAFAVVWHQPVLAFLVRQPLSRAQWVRYLAPSLLVAFLPVAGIWWLAPHYVNSVAHYSGFVGLAWPIILGASYGGRSAVLWIAIGTSALAVLILGYAWQPAVAYLALIATVVLIPLSVSAIPDRVAGSGQIGSGHLASAWPTLAIVRRDLCYLWRMERNCLFGLAAAGTVAALMMFALRVNGHAAGGEAFVYACGLSALAVMPIYEVLERAKKGLGPEFMRRRWPVTHCDRSIALFCVLFVLAGPSFIAMAALGSSMGVGFLVLFTLYATTTLICYAVLFSFLLVEPNASPGWSMLVLLVHTILAIALPPWIYGILAAIGIPVGFVLVMSGLRKFTHTLETGILEQPA